MRSFIPLLFTLALAACADSIPHETLDKQADTGLEQMVQDEGAVAALGAPTLAQQHEALSRWAERAQVLAWVSIEHVEPYITSVSPGLRTEAVLRVRQVLRNESDVEFKVDNTLWLDLPGGSLGETEVYTSDAPLLFEGDEVLAALVQTPDGLQLAGARSVLPVREGAIEVCVNPEHAALTRCIDAGAGLVFSPALELFERADDVLSILVSELAL
jgi:hypothetical protein